MEEFLKDERFAHIPSDPKFRKIPRAERKVKIDKRFEGMFKEDRFRSDHMVDKRGRPQMKKSAEELKKYYDVSSSDEDEDEAQDKEGKSEPESSDEDEEVPVSIKDKLKDLDVDYARGEAALASESSSDEESSSEESGEDEEHDWGEMDKDAGRLGEGEDVTCRLALCNMDWDRIKASDLFVLFNSFLAPGQIIESIAIYPSEYGLERMKEEDAQGPKEVLTEKHEKDDEEEDEEEEEEEDEEKMEKFRKYQLNRLKYYYAVITCNSPSAANRIYEECDGMEYESSAAKVDLRFIPDDMEFDQEAKNRCDKLPNLTKYDPRYFVTTALQQAKVDLTWDETDPDRIQTTSKAFESQEDLDDEDVRAFLASDSESDEPTVADGSDDEENSKRDQLTKYRALLQGIEEQDKKKSNNMEMEVTWEVGLKDKAEEMVKQMEKKKIELTPWEQFLEKKKSKKKQKEDAKKENDEEYSDDDIPSDVDMNDPYFKSEMEGANKTKGKKNKKVKHEEQPSDNAELELMMLGDSDDKKHFNMDAIIEEEKDSKKKKKRRKGDKKVEAAKQDDFQINVDDPRFSAIYTSASYHVDPSNPSFKKTKAMDAIISTKLKRRAQQDEKPVSEKKSRDEKARRQDPDLAKLVNSVKNKASTFKWKGK